MPVFTDQIGRSVELRNAPKRIISTVPSQTELLYDLGLEKEVVGITAYCVHPGHWLKEKTVIGGTKNLNLNLIRSLQPDLLIGNKEENIKEQIDKISSEIPVFITEVFDHASAMGMIQKVGEVIQKTQAAGTIISNIENSRLEIEKITPSIRFMYLIWSDPLMGVGGNTYISSLFEDIGLQNCLGDTGSRYPEISQDQIAGLKPDIIFLSSEPYQFSTADTKRAKDLVPSALVKIVDGELFSWYGSRILLTMKHLQKIITEIKLYFSL